MLDSTCNLLSLLDTKSGAISSFVDVSAIDIAGDGKGNVYVHCKDGSIIKLEQRSNWKEERLLWIAFHKEDPGTCFLAALPRDVIREIIGHMILI